MMKKLLTIVLVLLFSSFVLAQGQQGEGQGNGQGTPQLISVNNGADDSGKGMQQQETQSKRNLTQVRAMVQARQQEMNQEMGKMGQGQQNMYQNQNQVRLAVHALLAMEDVVGGIGKNVSAIAKEFNNSVQATIRAEERIQTRNRIARFFAGGDNKAGEEIEQEVNQNQQRIQELKQLREQCECGEEVKSMFQEQIQSMEQEQNRLQELAQAEKKSKGLFGWLWK